MKDKAKELQFLQVIRVNGNLYHLTLSGWTYREVIEMLSDFSRSGLVTIREDGTMLTIRGMQYFKSLYKSLGKKGVSRFLSPASEHKMEPLSKESIYIPTT